MTEVRLVAKTASIRQRAMRIALPIAFAFLSACGLFLSEEAQLKRAQEAQKRGDLRAAVIDLKSILEKHPKNNEARFLLGTIDLESGDSQAAVRELERARTDGVAESRVSEPLARAYLASGQLDQALTLIDQEIAKSKSSGKEANAKEPLFLRLRGEAFFAKQEWQKARESFESALAVAPNDIKSLLGLGGVIEASEGAEAALKITDRAMAIAPNDATVHLARGALYLQLRKPTEASEAFAKSVELLGNSRKNDLVAALAGLSQSQLSLGQIPAALQSTERMQKIAPNAPVTRYTRAYALAQDGKLPQAQELLAQNLAQGGDSRSRMLMGAINLMQGQLSQAEINLSSVVASEPNNNEAKQLLAQARLRQSKPGEALDILLPALDGGNAASASMLALAGQASLAAGKGKEGVAYLKRSADAHPEDLGAQLDLAAGYVATGQADQALALLGAGNQKTATQATDEKKQGDSANQLVRREYLSVLALLQKNDAAGAIASAVNAAKQHPDNSALQALAGSILTRQRQFSQARPYVEEVIRLRPNDAAGYANLGRLELLQGNVDASRRSFQTALQKKPGDSAATTSLALIEMSQQRVDAALTVLTESRKQNAKNIEPRVLETQILIMKGRLDDAEKLARENLELAPDEPSVMAALGRVLSTKGQHAQAIETFEHAVQKQPQNAPLRFQLAMAFRMAGKLDEAAEAIQTVLKIDAHHVPALQMDGLLAIGRGDLTNASKRLDELLKVAPEQPATYELLARLRGAQQRWAESADAFAKAAALHPSAAYAVGEYEARTRGKLPSPEASLDKFLSAHPGDVMTRVALAQAQQARGDRAGAESSYQQVLSNQPRNPIALNNLAWMHHEDGKKDAVDLARRAYEVAPDAPAIADTYAWILVAAGQAKDAVKLLDPFVGSSSRGANNASPEIRAHYAVALAKSGRNEEARALARELNAKDSSQLSAEARALLTDLAKS